MAQNVITDTPQEMQNLGFDTKYSQPSIEIVGEDSANNVLRRIQVDSNGFIITSGGGSGLTVNQGTPNTLANAWTVEVTDGTNILGTSSHPLNTNTFDGFGHAITSNSSSPSGNRALDVNVMSVLGSTWVHTAVGGGVALGVVNYDSSGNALSTVNTNEGYALNINVPDTPGNGSLTAAAQSVILNVTDGNGTVSFSVTGNWTGTIEFFGADILGSYYAIPAVRSDWSGINTPINTAYTTNGLYRVGCTGLAFVEIVSTGVWTGTANIQARVSSATGVVRLETMIPAGVNIIGSVNLRDAASHLLTSNSTSLTSSFALDSNLLAIKGTVVNIAAAGTLLVGVADGTGNAISSTSGGLNVTTTSATINIGQKTVNTSAVQISSSSTVPTNGILIGALSTNSASIFIGSSGVTTSTGEEIQPGQVLPFTCNLNTLYIISVASTTDKIWYSVL